MRQNKFDYLVVLQGYYGRWEDLSAAKDDRKGYKEMRSNLNDYRKNEKGSYRIIRRRELIEV